MLFDPLDRILGTPTKVRVLRALSPLRKGVSGREVARRAGVSRAAMGALDELVDMGIVTREEPTGQHLYSLNRRNYFAARLGRLFEEEDARVTSVFQAIRNGLGLEGGRDSVGAILTLAVFGSAARGQAGPRSDFDLLAVTASEASVEPVYDALAGLAEVLREQFGLRLSPVVLTLRQLQARAADGDPFVQEVLQDAVPVHGRPAQELLGVEAGKKNA
jgi:predicted nucleotidyltransferase/DNA-binding transcriptional ArsR family regulator